MKIAFDNQIFNQQKYGGISRYICSLAFHLSAEKIFEPQIFAPLHLNAYLKGMPKGLVVGKQVPSIPKTGRAIQLVSRLLARPLIRAFHPDILHHTYYRPDIGAIGSARRVVTVYDMIHERYSELFPANDVTSAFKLSTVKAADHVICISESTRRDLIELFDIPAEKVSVIYLGFDRLHSDANLVNSDKPYILYVGHRGGYKNFSGFLKAYAHSSWLRNNFNILCFGGEPFSLAELRMFKELGLLDHQVSRRIGSDSDLADGYRGAAIFVYPSAYEGFGIPPLEAMSLNCPVACSNSSSIPEVVGEAGVYFDPLDIDSIQYTLEQTLSSPERLSALVLMGKMRCLDFSWKQCAEETAVIYKSLM